MSEKPHYEPSIYEDAEKVYNSGEVAIRGLSIEGVRAAVLLDYLREYVAQYPDATVDIECDHYDGDFPIKRLELVRRTSPNAHSREVSS